MNSLENLHFIGKITKHKGIEGNLVIVLDESVTFTKKILYSFLFIKQNGVFVPFRFTDFQVISKESFLVKFETLNSKEEISKFIGSEVYVTKESFKESFINNHWQDIFVGYSVYSNGKIIGNIKSVNRNSVQPIFILKQIHTKKEQLIPAVEELIVQINNSEKTLEMKLPKGLLDL